MSICVRIGAVHRAYRIAEKIPDEDRFLDTKAWCGFAAGQFAAADRWQTRYVEKLGSDTPAAWRLLGRIRKARGKHAAAAQCFQRSLVLLKKRLAADPEQVEKVAQLDLDENAE